jgi:hypothetical protein
MAVLCGCGIAAEMPAMAQVEVKGVPLGAFRLYPTLQLNANYDDNIYRTDAGVVDDSFFTEVPGFVLQSNWLRHELNLFGNVTAYQYASKSSENRNDWNLGGSGRLDITNGFDLIANGSYNLLHEARTSPDQPGYAKSPTEYSLGQAHAAIGYHPYHFSFTVGGDYSRYDYDPTQLIGFADLNNNDRNRDEYSGYVKGGYEFSPGYAVFIQANYRDIQYDLKTDRTGLNRTNHGYSMNSGLDMLVTDLIKGQIFIGYLKENYAVGLSDVSGFNFGANVDWNPSPFWTLHLTASRTPSATTVAKASASDDQTVRLGVDYAILPTVTIVAHGSYTDSDFLGSVRHDKYSEGGIGATYFANRYVDLKVEFTHQERSSSLGGANYKDNLIYGGLNLHI